MRKILSYILIINASLLTLVLNADEDVGFYLNSANNLLEKREYDAAIRNLSKVLLITDNSGTKAKVNNAIGWSHYSAGDSQSAIKYLKKSYDLALTAGANETAIRAVNNLGLVEFSLGNYKESKKYFETDLVLNTEISKEYLPLIEDQLIQSSTNEYVSEGIVHRLNKEFDKALIEYDKALALTPDNATILDYKGYALFRLGKYSESIDALRKAYSINGAGLFISINLLKVYCGSGDFESAKKYMKDNPSIINDNDALLSDGELVDTCKGRVSFENEVI
ncbi:MAG: tetratricopeptide repeat protein [Bermanella sp.]